MGIIINKKSLVLTTGNMNLTLDILRSRIFFNTLDIFYM